MILDLIRDREPALVGQVVSAGIGLAVTLGLDLPDGVDAAIVTLVVAVITMLVRRNVTPEAQAVRREVTAAEEAAIRTAAELGRDTVGAVGDITEDALEVVGDVVEEVVGATEDDDG